MSTITNLVIDETGVGTNEVTFTDGTDTLIATIPTGYRGLQLGRSNVWTDLEKSAAVGECLAKIPFLTNDSIVVTRRTVSAGAL